MSRRSMRANEFWDPRQLSLFDYIQEKKGGTRQRRSKKHKQDSAKPRIKFLKASGGVRIALLRRGGPNGWEVIPPEEVTAAGRRKA